MIALHCEDSAVLRIIQATVALSEAVVAVAEGLNSRFDCGIGRFGVVLERDKRSSGIPELKHCACSVLCLAIREPEALDRVAVAVPDRPAVAQRELIERRIGGNLRDLGRGRPVGHPLKCMRNRTDGLICQGLPSAIGDSRGVQATYQCISGAVCGHLRALFADGHGRVGGKQRVHTEAVRVRLRADPVRRVVVRDLSRLGELPQDDEVAQRARSRLALESLPGEPCHADKIALASKTFTCGLSGLVHGIAARQHSDDTAGAHGGHGPLDHVVVERHSVDFYRV